MKRRLVLQMILVASVLLFGGWFLAVEYEHDGNITDYYLTNVRK